MLGVSITWPRSRNIVDRMGYRGLELERMVEGSFGICLTVDLRTTPLDIIMVDWWICIFHEYPVEAIRGVADAPKNQI